MTREEAIRILKYNSNVIHQTINGETDPKEVEALDMAIRSLEQEPVIDKIRERVELEKLGYPPSAGYYKAIMKVLQIIDKYKESEEQI